MLAGLLFGCGVKKGYVVGDYGKQPLYGEVVGTIESADSSLAGRATLGLWWQRDSLQITLNQGRQLKAARAKGDTLYLYETQRDSMDVATRQYNLYIPQRELFVVKYNDSLVYPIMPAKEKCEYPLEIKSMSEKKLYEFIRKQEESKNKSQTQPILSPNHETYPLELRAGTYLFNADSYKLGVDCDCVTDSTKKLLLRIDGSWQQYDNDELKNCGIMRKAGLPLTYEMANYKWLTVLFSDTSSIAGHIIGLKEDKRRWKEKISYASNEYFCYGRTSSDLNFEYFKIYSCKQEDTFSFFYGLDDNGFRLEGSTCGWIRIKNK